MLPQVPLPTISAVDANAAGTAPSGTPAGRAIPILLDVRERHEFVAVRAAGALLSPTSTFLARFEELPRDRPIHVICHTGNRSAAVTAFLLRNGWTDVCNVAGGMDAWERAGLDVRRGSLAPGEGDPPADHPPG
jgi:rhodanese-related sulfurtransferase